MNPLAREPLAVEEAKSFAQVFKALGDPVRLRLLSVIASHPNGEVCVCDMSEDFDLSSPTISYHLKALRAADLIDAERRGTWVYYRVQPQMLSSLCRLLNVPEDVGAR
ncbi:ArsR/SmtB family transcription factor [Herbidospora cretacea]|uniref:ArsR/SmtB family transcription factor n=1 Tax=Herbidospora cretacea TaxID=28444 RepID=UPI000774BADA|nr:metalloregulator ArsR/SmtB family transcription factor [Herbidospora cretacea]